VRGYGEANERGSLSLQSWFTQFAPIPTLLQKITRMHNDSGADIALEMTQMQLDPSFQLLEQLVSDMTLVYSPPKVGGQTIAATIRAHPGFPRPKHIHFMSDAGLAFMDSLVERCRTPLNRQRWYECIAQSRWTRTLLALRKTLRFAGMASIVPKPVIIAGVREPMAQYISLVFEHWWMYADSPHALTAEGMLAQMAEDPWRNWCKNWFAHELGQMTGLNILARPFPIQQGWQIYENDLARVLIIRQENLDRLQEALGKLYGIDPAAITVENRNIADSKDYASHYANVRKEWSPSEGDMAAIYSHPHVRHFYTPEEIAMFQERWRSGPRSQGRACPSELRCDREVKASQDQLASTQRRLDPPEYGHFPHSNHGRNCRPCAHCVQEMRLIPILRHACEERLELIQNLDAALRPRPLRERFRGVINRLLRTTGVVA
jgi:hypothetical protein